MPEAPPFNPSGSSEERITAHWALCPTPTGVEVRQGVRCVVDPYTSLIMACQAEGQEAWADIDLSRGTTLLTPGLINTHTHLELFRTAPIERHPDQTFADWLLAVIDYKRGSTMVDAISACHHSMVELITSGTTCVNDISSEGASLVALEQIGLRGTVSPESIILGDLSDVGGPTAEQQCQQAIERWLSLQESWDKHPLLRLGVSPHSPYNMTPAVWEQLVTHTTPALVHTHLAETRDELTYFKTGSASLSELDEKILGKRFAPPQVGVSPVVAYEAQWGSHTNVVAAHGVFLDEADIGILAQHDVAMAHCPQSNQWLSGIEAVMPYHKLKAAGLRVGLGTDSSLSCPRLDLRTEARLAQTLHGLGLEETLQLCTVNGAAVLEQAELLGQLREGYKADLVLWWHPSADPATLSDPLALWLDPDTIAVMVWVDGRLILDRCDTLWSQ